MKVKTKLDNWRELPAIKEYSEKYGSFTDIFYPETKGWVVGTLLLTS